MTGECVRPAVVLLALLLIGCPGGPDPKAPPEIDLSKARTLESEGKTFEALTEYARLIKELNSSGRNDARAQAARARILGSLFKLNVAQALVGAPMDVRDRCDALLPWCTPGGRAFLCAGASGHWTQVLSLGAEAPVLAEAAGAIADHFTEKLDDASLRRGRIEPQGDLNEKLYRRALLEAASEYARYAVSRGAPKDAPAATRTIRLLRRLARELRELAAFPGVLPGPAARWSEQADRADADAIAFRPSREADLTISNDLRQEIESDASGILKTATDYNNKANDLLSRRADEGEILEALERSLRCFVTARECLVEPTAIQKRTLDVMSMAADALRHQAFKN